jgi:hypothetical protein
LEGGVQSRYLPDPSDFIAPIRISLAAPAFNEEGGDPSGGGELASLRGAISNGTSKLSKS